METATNYNTQDLAAAGARPKRQAKSKAKAKSSANAVPNAEAKACVLFVCYFVVFVVLFCLFVFVDLMCQDGGGNAEPVAEDVGGAKRMDGGEGPHVVSPHKQTNKRTNTQHCVSSRSTWHCHRFIESHLPPLPPLPQTGRS